MEWNTHQRILLCRNLSSNISHVVMQCVTIKCWRIVDYDQFSPWLGEFTWSSSKLNPVNIWFVAKWPKPEDLNGKCFSALFRLSRALFRPFLFNAVVRVHRALFLSKQFRIIENVTNGLEKFEKKALVFYASFWVWIKPVHTF